jgi:hypothetical protein
MNSLKIWTMSNNMNSPEHMDENTVKEQEAQDPKEGVNIQITIGDDGGTPQKIIEKGRKKLLIK